jgi:hypothetical protein
MTIRIGVQEIPVPAFMADPKHRKEFDRFLELILKAQAEKVREQESVFKRYMDMIFGGRAG